MTRLLFGRPLAERVNAESKERARRLADRGRAPSLAAVSVGSEPSATAYVARLQRAGAATGVAVTNERVPAGSGADDIGRALDRLSSDPTVSGVLLLRPLPQELDASAVLLRIPLVKDIEGMHPISVGHLAEGRPRFVPTTAEAVIALLGHYDIPIRGRRVTVIGRSAVFGRPLASLLLIEDATVTVAHRGTADLARHSRDAEIVAVGVGRAAFLRGDTIAPGATVIDAGINVTPDGITGDADAESIARVAGAYSPVPGGLGSVTTALLLRNVVRAAEELDAAD
ncbi:bifunctional 5,10-methylenetetrahydrofolate dehydrogenase/5,10-methenyltetrahydrofolate cyclohydrolase [soil metagenome]